MKTISLLLMLTFGFTAHASLLDCKATEGSLPEIGINQFKDRWTLDQLSYRYLDQVVSEARVYRVNKSYPKYPQYSVFAVKKLAWNGGCGSELLLPANFDYGQSFRAAVMLVCEDSVKEITLRCE